MIKKALIHRYDNEKDILAAQEWLFSDVHKRAKGFNHELLIIVPTLEANTPQCIFGNIRGGQQRIKQQVNWPGRPDHYEWRVYMNNAQRTTLEKIQMAIEGDLKWNGHWEVSTRYVHPTDLPLVEGETITYTRRQRLQKILEEMLR
jgi:hypothetical protein